MRRLKNCNVAAWYAASSVIVAATCVLMLWADVTGCKDPIMTNDPREEIISTKIALVVTTTPLDVAGLIQWDTSIITVTVHDTNANTDVNIVSASITGRNPKYFRVIDSAKFPMSIKAKDSVTFRVQFVPGDTGIMLDSVKVLVDTAVGVNAEAPFIIGNVKGANTPFRGALSLSDTSFDFGFVEVNSASSKNIIITSTGTSPVRITDIYFVGSDSVNFSCNTIPSLRTPFVLSPGSSITLRMQFTPYSLQGHFTTLVITADSLQSDLVYLTGIGANNGMSVVPSQIKFSYFDSTASQAIALDTLYDYNLDTNIHYVDSIKVQVNSPADTALFTVFGTFPVAAYPPSGPNKASGLLTPIAIIRFNGTPTTAPHYGYLQVYFRNNPASPILVPLLAGPF